RGARHARWAPDGRAAQDRRGALAGALTRPAAAAPPDGDPLEGATAAAAAVDRPGHGDPRACSGVTALFAADGTRLPAGSREITPVREDTLFDLASVTKVVTALTAATLIDDGVLDPHSPVAEHMRAPDPRITAHHLLTHTAGLPPEIGGAHV